MRPEDFFAQLTVDKSAGEKTGFNPYYHTVLSGTENGVISFERENLIDLASNNYLGLACDPRVKEGIERAARTYGASLCGTPIATGYTGEMARLEKTLARFVGLEAALVFPSGYQANAALFSAIAQKQDLILVDHYAHASLIHGAKSTGCKFRPFLHNNMGHLERQLQRASSHRQVFVVTESVFSIEGSIAPIKELAELCDHYNALPVVDDSHGIGVLGTRGHGILEHADLEHFEGIYTASLGKALANAGGMVAGPANLIEYLRYYCPGLVYSTALPPSTIGGVLAVLDIIEKEFHTLSGRMWRNKAMLVDGLCGSGFEIVDSEAPITSIRCESAEQTVALSKLLFQNGIASTPFIPPSVPSHACTVRLIAGAGVSEEDMKRVLEVFQRIAVQERPGTKKSP
ncbi:MAG: aminotransferase class I/II-fold pyridoxal phosphate-dependent enzyme [Candidatus Latescibacterota bacterium]|nr:MAG: aminotransferase class I/II-fold pyridoxal phosphate-dependent enzyme [Candidatus Latescibacterota bacterium]